MREIKFRVWDKKKNRWFHGSTDPERIATSTDAINLFGEVITFGELMVDQNNEEAVSLDRLNDLVVLQYTGLKDKNGKEIYEGDILEHHRKFWRVSFDNGWFQVDQIGRTPSPDGGEFPPDSDLLGNQYEVCEVIGNIYENGDLLNA